MWLRRAVLCSFSGLVSVACTNDRPSPAPDSAVADAGAGDTGAHDAGIDAATPDAGPSCREEIVRPFVGAPPCSMATQDCVGACTDSSCLDRCLAADPSATCQDCLDRAIVVCINRNGCQPHWNCYRACIVEHCPLPTAACIKANCLEPENAWNACSAGEPLRVCATSYTECLPG